MRPNLPRRDLWLLPLIAGLTVLTMLVLAETGARAVWPEQGQNACQVPDPVLHYRFKPNCTSTMKTVEGPWFDNHYNECGYRSAQSCGPVTSGGRRIALIGSSLSEGYMVPYPDTIGSRLGQDLTRQCGMPVEVQNLGGIGYFVPRRLTARLDEALRLKPDAVLLVLAPADIESGMVDDAPNPGGDAPSAKISAQARLFRTLKQSRAVVVAQHFLFRDMSVYLPLYLRYGDKADFLRPPFTEAWQERIRQFDTLVDALTAKTNAAGVPLLIAFVPQEAEIALMAGRPLPAGIDPGALPRVLAAVSAKHGAGFVDTSEALRTRSEPERLYYQVDGHLSGEGQPIAADFIARQLVASAGSAFKACEAPAPTGRSS